MDRSDAGWDERDSHSFIDHGRYFVPERELQLSIISGLIPALEPGAQIVDLCCGEGLLAKRLLDDHPGCRVHAFDGSQAMLARSRELLAPFGDRAMVNSFELEGRGWRRFPWPVHAAVSSLAIHHLDGEGKRALFGDVASALSPGGAFLIADLIRPANELGKRLAARVWDETVRARAIELDGDTATFESFCRENWNLFSDPEPDPIDQPSPLLDQLQWLEQAGLADVDVFWMKAGHAIYGGYRPVVE